MEFIATNEKTIKAWYSKQLVKEDVCIPNLPYTDGWLDIPHPSNLKTVEEKLGKKAVLINVIPFLCRNLCHFNVSKMLQILNKKEKRYKGVLGYNVTGCPCGKLYGIEIHSVLKCGDEYIDLTKDFAGATKKYFIPLCEWDFDEWDCIKSVVQNFKDNGVDMANFGVSHSCRLPKGILTWNEPKLVEWERIHLLIDFFF